METLGQDLLLALGKKAWGAGGRERGQASWLESWEEELREPKTPWGERVYGTLAVTPPILMDVVYVSKPQIHALGKSGNLPLSSVFPEVWLPR